MYSFILRLVLYFRLDRIYKSNPFALLFCFETQALRFSDEAVVPFLLRSAVEYILAIILNPLEFFFVEIRK